MTNFVYVIIREICSEFDGTWSTPIGVASSEFAAKDVVDMAELELEELLSLHYPKMPSPNLYWKGTVLDKVSWDKAFNQYKLDLESFKDKMKELLSVDAELHLDYFRDSGLQYSYERVPMF